jgi:hypothetical protein
MKQKESKRRRRYFRTLRAISIKGNRRAKGARQLCEKKKHEGGGVSERHGGEARGRRKDTDDVERDDVIIVLNQLMRAVEWMFMMVCV